MKVYAYQTSWRFRGSSWLPFRLWNNDSLPTQLCICSPTGESHIRMDEDSDSTTLHGSEINRGRGTAAVFLGEKRTATKNSIVASKTIAGPEGTSQVAGDEHSRD